jgi:hypothetical protein
MRAVCAARRINGATTLGDPGLARRIMGAEVEDIRNPALSQIQPK